MSEQFKRENRYIVIKRKDLEELEKKPGNYVNAAMLMLQNVTPHLPKRTCLVIESDWPEYEPAWQMIERRVTGHQPPALGEWAIDESAGRPILTYKGCSVIESEDAEYVMRLVAADKSTAFTPALGGEPEIVAIVIATGGPHDKEDRVLCEQQAELPPIGTKLIDSAHVAPLPAKISELENERDRLQAEVERLRSALKFYADREHYHFESGNWDTVSGEPLNILWNGEEPDFIEDGTVARNALAEGAKS